MKVANALIANNTERLGKALWSSQESGEPVQVVATVNEYQEAEFVANTITSLPYQGLNSRSEIAILVRTGFQTRQFEEIFFQRNIPYKIVGGLKFYDRLEIKDVISYIRLVVSLNDDLAFERIINVPKRGLGKATISQIQEYARHYSYSLLKATKMMLESNQIKGKAKAKLEEFLEYINKWHFSLGQKPHIEVVEDILNESGYLAMWQQEKTPESKTRLENIAELFRALQDFATLGEFLEHISLVSDNDENSDEDRVNIMTLHAAKGLEFDTVFLPGWEDGLFPHQRSLDEEGLAGLEEERRLAYVGITRGKRRVYISHAATRRIFNQMNYNEPSRFISEIPPELITKKNFNPYASNYSNSRAVYPEDLTEILFTGNKFKAGDRVFHQKFGHGYVQDVDGEYLDVNFDHTGLKKIVDRFVNLS